MLNEHFGFGVSENLDDEDIYFGRYEMEWMRKMKIILNYKEAKKYLPKNCKKFKTVMHYEIIALIINYNVAFIVKRVIASGWDSIWYALQDKGKCLQA